MTPTMDTPQTVVQALRSLALVLAETVAEAGAAGAPEGVLYGALQQGGVRLATFEAVLAALANDGLIRRAGHVAYSTATTAGWCRAARGAA